MTKEEVLQHDKKFRYMLLSRMQSDCEYYLNYGNRNPKRLLAGDEQRQIEYMILLHDSFKEDVMKLKPNLNWEYLTKGLQTKQSISCVIVPV